jgi:N-acetylmuramoyl-L-alanine amidase
VTSTPVLPQGVPSQDELAIIQHLVPVLTIWKEARGEGKDGMIGVANVIQRRIILRKQTPNKVCLDPFQFSCWNAMGNPERNLFADEHDATFWVAYFCWLEVLASNIPDPTGGADFYFNPATAKPSWGEKFKFTVRIGHHDFYRSY